VLISKKNRAESVDDYKPISIVHSVAKKNSKILASRLPPHLPQMVSSSQSAFVKKRCIHNNFVLIQSIAKELHKKKTPAIFIKLDIAKDFDSIS
jgi:hypothetical protein